MRIFFAGGGTGGHLYPGLAIARAMVALSPDVQPFFIGAKRGIERNVLPTTEFPHELLDLHPLYRSRPWENWKTLRGAVSAWKRMSEIVREGRPACVVGTGGYASGIALAYASVHGIPFAVQEQNSFPGLTTKFFSRYARQIHNGFPEAVRYLHPGRNTKVFDSGNPIEPPPVPLPDRSAARAAWNFPPMMGGLCWYTAGVRARRPSTTSSRAGFEPEYQKIFTSSGRLAPAHMRITHRSRAREFAFVHISLRSRTPTRQLTLLFLAEEQSQRLSSRRGEFLRSSYLFQPRRPITRPRMRGRFPQQAQLK